MTRNDRCTEGTGPASLFFAIHLPLRSAPLDERPTTCVNVCADPLRLACQASVLGSAQLSPSTATAFRDAQQDLPVSPAALLTQIKKEEEEEEQRE